MLQWWQASGDDMPTSFKGVSKSTSGEWTRLRRVTHHGKSDLYQGFTVYRVLSPYLVVVLDLGSLFSFHPYLARSQTFSSGLTTHLFTLDEACDTLGSKPSIIEKRENNDRRNHRKLVVSMWKFARVIHFPNMLDGTFWPSMSRISHVLIALVV